MTWTAKVAFVTVLSVLAVGCAGEDEACSPSEPTSSQSQALLQSLRTVSVQSTETSETETEHKDPGHKVLLLAAQHVNGTYVISKKPRHMSQLQQRIARAQSTNGLSGEMQEVLDFHNFYRCRHDVEQMTWDSTIAASAQAWADGGHYGHSSETSLNLPGIGKVGENLAWGYPLRSGKDSVEAWYDEIIFTDGTPSSCSDKNADARGKDICHYTQVVWKTSTKLGCGKGKAQVVINGETYNGDYWVCQYGAAGNYGGQFTDNVLPPVKAESDCPAPQLKEETQDTNCKDGAATDNPTITYSDGSKAECSTLGWACHIYDFVMAKCKKTCNAC